MSISNWRDLRSALKKELAHGKDREHTTYSSSSVSCATSGIVMVPLTSSSSFTEPAESQDMPSSFVKSALPSYSSCSFTSKSVITLPFRWLTSTSPSMLSTFETEAETSPLSADVPMRDFSRRCRAHSLTSLLTQCQLFGLWRTMLGGSQLK